MVPVNLVYSRKSIWCWLLHGMDVRTSWQLREAMSTE